MIDIGQARREVDNMTYVVCLASTGLGTEKHQVTLSRAGPCGLQYSLPAMTPSISKHMRATRGTSGNISKPPLEPAGNGNGRGGCNRKKQATHGSWFPGIAITRKVISLS